MTPDETLAEYFGNYLHASNDAWMKAKETLLPGTWIDGTVVATYTFGTFLDLGIGFPGFLPVTHYGEHPADSRTGCFSPRIGEVAAVRIVAVSDPRRQVGLTRRKHHPYLDFEPESSPRRPD